MYLYVSYLSHYMYLCLDRYKSENWGDASADKLGSSSGAARTAIFSVGSAEALRQPWSSSKGTDGKLQKKRISFINPFNPQQMHFENNAIQRRWAHVFPINKKGVAFQVHHAPIEEHLTSSIRSKKVSDSRSTTPHVKGSLKQRSILKQLFNTSSTQKVENNVMGTSPHSKVSTKLDGQRQSPTGLSQWEDKTPKRSLHKLTDSPSSGGPTPTAGRSQGQSSPIPFSSYRPNTPGSSRSQRGRMNDSSVPGTAEDFSSVRRTGMDWTSLVEPSSLPITTDYYPAKATLDQDYFQYNTNLVVFKEGTAEEGNEERRFVNGHADIILHVAVFAVVKSCDCHVTCRVPTWHSDHSTMNTFQAFQEMIAQRLSQVCESEDATIQYYS